MAETRTKSTTTRVSGLKAKMESGSSLPTDATAGVAGLPATSVGQQFYNTTNNAVHIHTGSSSWRKMGLTTTSTTTS